VGDNGPETRGGVEEELLSDFGEMGSGGLSVLLHHAVLTLTTSLPGFDDKGGNCEGSRSICFSGGLLIATFVCIFKGTISFSRAG